MELYFLLIPLAVCSVCDILLLDVSTVETITALLGGFMKTVGVKHEVIVGNIGTVYSGGDSFTAQGVYQRYVILSKSVVCGVAGENVTWIRNGEVCREHFGWLHQSESG